MELDSQRIVVASANQASCSVGGETIIVDLSGGQYFGADAVTAKVWQIIQQPTEVAQIRDAIVAEYDVEPARCEADLLRLLDSMLQAGLVEVRSA
jgi:ornithine carbamoyltransferase